MSEPEQPVEKDEDEPEDDDDFAPNVVLTTVGDLRASMPAGVGAKFAKVTAWFLLEQDAELVGLFDRVPEDPMSKGQVAAILGGLRAFASEHAEALQVFLGPTDGIGVGFHVDAPLAKVRASFEEDGFEVRATVRDGELTPEPEAQGT